MPWTNEKLESLYSNVMNRASFDEDFRNSLLAGDLQVIKELAGEEIPDSLKIKFIENESGYQQTVVLPDFIGEELNEEDLDKVAGGLSWAVVASVCGVAVSDGLPCAADICGIVVGTR